MPLYVYRCDKCRHEFERIAKLSDANPPCPKVIEDAPAEGETARCGHDTEKVFSGGGTFHLKGSGWASDGYS